MFREAHISECKFKLIEFNEFFGKPHMATSELYKRGALDTQSFHTKYALTAEIDKIPVIGKVHISTDNKNMSLVINGVVSIEQAVDRGDIDIRRCDILAVMEDLNSKIREYISSQLIIFSDFLIDEYNDRTIAKLIKSIHT